MSLRSRTIAVAVAALLAVGGGIYALGPNHRDDAPDISQVATPAESEAQPGAAVSQQPQVDQDPTVDQATAAVAADQKRRQASAPGQVSKQLTREQLTPPPLSETEKLEKAAQQESNF